MRELQARLDVLETIDMALIVSPGQNEIEHLKQHGLDILPHRKRMNELQPPLGEKSKDSDDPLRIVFLRVVAVRGRVGAGDAATLHFLLEVEGVEKRGL